MNEDKRRFRKVTIRLSGTEFQWLEKAWKQTTSRQRSDYIRAVLLRKPVTVYTRNKSFDDFVAELMLLKNEIRTIGNNFNQAVKKLHIMSEKIDIKAWIEITEKDRDLVLQKMEYINNKMSQFSNVWLRE